MKNHNSKNLRSLQLKMGEYTTELINAIVECIRESVLIMDADLRVIFANQSFYHTFKVHSKETESSLLYELGNNQWDIPQLRNILKDILPQKKILKDFLVDHDFPHIGNRIMMLNARQITSEKDDLPFIILVIEDITDREAKEAEMAGVGTWSWDIKTNALTWSQEVPRLFGLAKVPRSLTYKRFLRLVHPEDRREVELAVNRCIEEEGEYNVDHRIRLPDGSIHWLREKGNVIRDENNLAVRMLGVVMDITKEKKSALQQARLAAIVDSSSDAILLCTLTGEITHWNTGACTVFGYTENEMLGKSIFTLVPENKRDELDNILKNARKGKTCRYLETVRKRKDGKKIPIALSVTPILDEKGKVISITTIERDIDLRKKMETDLRNQQQELEKRVKQRTAALAKSRDQLQKEVEERRYYQQQLRSLTSEIPLIEEQERRKIASYLHDQVVQTLVYSNMKLNQIGQVKSDTVRNDILKEVSEYIQKTIGDLRNLTFEISPPILYELGFVKAVEWLAQQFQEQWGLSVEVNSTPVTGSFDENKQIVLFQSVRECLNNIRKHAQSENNEILIRKRHNNIKVEVIDHGKGFDQEKVQFRRGSNRKYGLINMRERIEYMNGSFDIQSRPGTGTSVRMSIPINKNSDKKGNIHVN